MNKTYIFIVITTLLAICRFTAVDQLRTSLRAGIFLFYLGTIVLSSTPGSTYLLNFGALNSYTIIYSLTDD
jgi:hypothetical protein